MSTEKALRSSPLHTRICCARLCSRRSKMTGSWDRPCRNPGRQCMRAPCSPGISADSSPADRRRQREKKRIPKGDHVTPASAAVSPFPSPSSLPPGPSPRRQQLRRPAGQPAGPCLLVWPPSTPPAALSSPMPTPRCRQTLAAPDRVLPCNLLHRSPALGGDRCGRSITQQRPKTKGFGTAIRANSG